MKKATRYLALPCAALLIACTFTACGAWTEQQRATGHAAIDNMVQTGALTQAEAPVAHERLDRVADGFGWPEALSMLIAAATGIGAATWKGKASAALTVAQAVAQAVAQVQAERGPPKPMDSTTVAKLKAIAQQVPAPTPSG